MRVIVAGGHTHLLTDFDRARLDKLHAEIGITEVVSGRARGADRGGEEWANLRGIPVKPFPADWDKYKRPHCKNPAGIIRNGEMAKYVGSAGAVVLFPGETGTQNMYEQAEKHGLKIYDWRE